MQVTIWYFGKGFIAFDATIIFYLQTNALNVKVTIKVTIIRKSVFAITASKFFISKCTFYVPRTCNVCFKSLVITSKFTDFLHGFFMRVFVIASNASILSMVGEFFYEFIRLGKIKIIAFLWSIRLFDIIDVIIWIIKIAILLFKKINGNISTLMISITEGLFWNHFDMMKISVQATFLYCSGQIIEFFFWFMIVSSVQIFCSSSVRLSEDT